jgi:predicted lipoprotein with Yx(FWY)xxD motif
MALLFLIMLLTCACQPAAASTPAPTTVVPPAAPTTLPTPTSTSEPTAVSTAEPSAPPTTAPTDTPAASPTAAFDEPAISAASHPTLGDILVGDNGLTLYIFTRDEPGKSNCTDECLDFWPPLLTQGSPELGPGVDPALVGTAALADGSRILTYNQMPLYYYYLDAQPGDASGVGADGAWFALSPTGSVVQLPAPTQPKEKDDDGYGRDY